MFSSGLDDRIASAGDQAATRCGRVVRRERAKREHGLRPNELGRHAMTRMLASVADAAEAEVVLQLGADVVDLKDPRRGALGAVPLDAAREALAIVARRRETSAALGDPPYDEHALADARTIAAMGVDTVKLAVDGPTLDRLGDSLERL